MSWPNREDAAFGLSAGFAYGALAFLGMGGWQVGAAIVCAYVSLAFLLRAVA